MTEINKPCDLLLPYFLKELASEASEAFAEHLTLCPVCREELTELQQVWQALPYEMEEVELSEADKSRMLERIFTDLGLDKLESSDGVKVQQEPRKAEILEQSTERGSPFWNKRGSLAAAAVLCLVIGAAAGWGMSERVSKPSKQAGETLLVPAQVLEHYTLKSYDTAMPSAKGTCWIQQQGDTKRLVLEMNGLHVNAGDQAYQLWVIKAGTRYNGGTFRVDEKGNGILTYDLAVIQGTFEALGITLEPDAQGTQPRGKKVLGT